MPCWKKCSAQEQDRGLLSQPCYAQQRVAGSCRKNEGKERERENGLCEKMRRQSPLLRGGKQVRNSPTLSICSQKARTSVLQEPHFSNRAATHPAGRAGHSSKRGIRERGRNTRLGFNIRQSVCPPCSASPILTRHADGNPLMRKMKRRQKRRPPWQRPQMKPWPSAAAPAADNRPAETVLGRRNLIHLTIRGERRARQVGQAGCLPRPRPHSRATDRIL